METAREDEHVSTTERDKNYHDETLERFTFAQERANGQSITTADQLTITLRNFALVQLGNSGRIVTNSTPRHAQDCKQHRSLVKRDTHGGLKPDSVPDDASGVILNSSKPIYSILRPCEGRFDSKDQQVGSTLREEKEVEHADVECRMPLITKHGSLTGRRCENVMKTLEELQDNGRFDAHEELSCKLLEFFTKREDHDMIASVMIERGVAAYYANDLKTSRRLYKAVIRMGDKLQNRSLLQGRAYVQLAVVYRYEFGKAIQCLELAKQLLSHHEAGEDTAEMCYYFGLKYLYLYWFSFSEEGGRQVLRTQAKEYLEKAIAHCTRDERPRVQLKKKRYFSLRLAALYLDCGTRAARQTRRVTNEDIKEAKKHLDFVEFQLSDGMPGGTEIQLLKARTDQFYREERFDVAMETAKRALGIAERINMQLEIAPLNERIEECDKLLTASSTDVVLEQFNDSSLSADTSNNSE